MHHRQRNWVCGVAMLCTLTLPAQESVWEDAWYVTASSGLRVRSMSGDPVDRVAWGEPLCEKLEMGPTGRRDTVEGLPGEWMQFVFDGKDVQVFDAYLWCTEPPSHDVEWAQYADVHMDGRNLREFTSCTMETEGGSSSTEELLFGAVSSGQAHQFFRLVLRHWVGEDTSSLWPEVRDELDVVLTQRWNPSEPLQFTLPTEGGALSWRLEYDAERRTARLFVSMGSC